MCPAMMSPVPDVTRQGKAVPDAWIRELRTSQAATAGDRESMAIQMACHTHQHPAFTDCNTHNPVLLTSDSYFHHQLQWQSSMNSGLSYFQKPVHTHVKNKLSCHRQTLLAP